KNKHVFLEDDVDYTVFTNKGDSYPATVLARDPVQDLAVLKIDTNGEKLPFVTLGNSTSLKIGQTVVAIGNALGEFRNTVSVGVISGLGRTITASDGSGSFVETIEDIVQTDAAINRGNSGGPLLNLAGEVIGINTATVLQAQNIGFAIPVNKVERDVKQVKELGRIVYPFLGIQYSLITPGLKEEQNLPVEEGAFISSITPDSAAQAAGLQIDDIILEFNGEKITTENSLAKIIQQHNPGDIATLLVMRQGSVITLTATLGERSE
ncbi:MAG: S1C family serine protease, partial [Waddliaceae bacterium]